MLDLSGSIGAENWLKMKLFIKDFVRRFPIGPNQNQVSESYIGPNQNQVCKSYIGRNPKQVGESYWFKSQPGQ